MEPEGQITALLRQWREGDREALDHLMPLVYPRLRAIAGSFEARDRSATLQATALVHEVYLRLLRQRSLNWDDREHFFSFSAQMMRLILVDGARARLASKRDSGRLRGLPLHEHLQWVTVDPEDILGLNLALDELAVVDSRKVRLIELRYFLGCTSEEAADVVQLSKATVDRELQVARAWLFRRLKGAASDLPQEP